MKFMQDRMTVVTQRNQIFQRIIGRFRPSSVPIYVMNDNLNFGLANLTSMVISLKSAFSVSTKPSSIPILFSPLKDFCSISFVFFSRIFSHLFHLFRIRPTFVITSPYRSVLFFSVIFSVFSRSRRSVFSSFDGVCIRHGHMIA